MIKKTIRRISLEHLWIMTVIVGVFVFVNTQPIQPHDFWWHIAIGREIVTTLSIPAVDAYSFTMPGVAYPSYQMFWLADLSLYILYQLGGPTLVVFLQSLIITSTYSLLLWLCWKESRSWRIAAFGTLFAVGLGVNNWNVRPQTISFLIGVIYLLSIYSFRKQPKLALIAVFPIGMLIWVNSHGSFVLGLGLLAIWLGDEIWKIVILRYKYGHFGPLNTIWMALGAFCLTLIVCLVNPRGFGIINYVLNLTSNPIVQDLVPEWAPPSFNNLYGTVFIIALLFSAVIFAVSPKRPDFFQLMTFIGFGILALKTTRGVIWFGLAMAPVLAYHISNTVKSEWIKVDSDKKRSGNPLLNLLMMSILIIIAVLSLPWFKHRLPFPKMKADLISMDTPVQATKFLLEEQVPGNLFHEMGFGSYLIWAAQSEIKVFADPRIELYPREIWWDYVSVLNTLPNWQEILEKYEINTIMINPKE